MRLLHRVRMLLASVTRRGRMESELDEELRFHIERETEHLIASGFSKDAARLRALQTFGGLERAREGCRDARATASLETLLRDVRQAARRLTRDVRFTASAVLILGLGVGANTAVYQLFDAVRLRTLPVRDPQQLTVVQLADRTGWVGRRTTAYPTLSHPLWERFRDQQDVFEGALAWAGAGFRVDPDGPEARGLFVSGDFFHVLGVPPMLGRVFTASDDRRGCGVPGAVLSHGYWVQRFGGDPAVIGRTIPVNGHRAEVIGVTPPEFFGVEVGRPFDLAVPICSHEAIGVESGWLDDGMTWWLTVMGRMDEDRTLARVNARLGAASPGLFEATLPPDYPPHEVASYLRFRLTAVAAGTGVSGLRDRYGDPLALLLVTTLLVLLVACANLASLILARASSRAREYALRVALGASRGRLARELMIENGILATVGAAAGLAIASALSGSLLRLFGSRASLELAVDSRVVAVVLAQAVLTLLVFGLIPVWQASTAPAARVLRSGGHGHSAGRESVVLRQWLVVTQVAISVVLLFGALLFAGTLRNLLAVDAGFETRGISVARVDYSRLDPPGDEGRAALKRELLARILSVPGVLSAAEVRHLPFGGTGGSLEVLPEGADPTAPSRVRLNGVSEGYLETMGIGLIAGRDFTEGDTESSPPVALVNPELVRRLGLEGNPVGARFRVAGGPPEADTEIEIVGLVPNTKYFALREDVLPIVFVPMAQIDDPRGFTEFVVRSRRTSEDLAPEIRSAVAGVRAGLGVDLRPFDSTVRDGLLRERLLATLVGFFGALSVLIAVVGLYGVLTHLVMRRTKEIGIRIALGARRADVLTMVLARAGALVGLGLAVGAVLAFVTGRFAESLVFGIRPQDLEWVVLACVLLGAVAMGASWLPARRAATLEPMAALRSE